MWLQSHPPTLSETYLPNRLSPHYHSSQLIRGSARVSSNPLNISPLVPGSLSGLLVGALLVPTPPGVSGGTRGRDARLCTWAPTLERDARGSGLPPPGQPWAALKEEVGTGGRRGRAAGLVCGGRARRPPSLVSFAHIWTRLPVPRNFPSCLPPPRPSPGAGEGGREARTAAAAAAPCSFHETAADPPAPPLALPLRLSGRGRGARSRAAR